MSEIKYRIQHVGINTDGDADALALANTLNDVFGLEGITEKPVAFFAGSLFEVMKNRKRGLNGHIAMETDNVEAAMADLSGKGITFLEDTIKRAPDGHINFVYLEQQWGGFAVHLTEKV